MSNELFCLECDVLLMRLYGKADLASVDAETREPPESAGHLEEMYTCPDCGKVLTRGKNGEFEETRE